RQRSAPAPGQERQAGEERRGGQGKGPGFPAPGRRVPPRIDEGQRMRPNQFAQVEPEGAAGDEQALRDAELEVARKARAKLPLEPRRRNRGGEPESEPGSQRPNVPPRLDPAPPPPDEDQQRERQNRRRRLAQEGQREKAGG